MWLPDSSLKHQTFCYNIHRTVSSGQGLESHWLSRLIGCLIGNINKHCVACLCLIGDSIPIVNRYNCIVHCINIKLVWWWRLRCVRDRCCDGVSTAGFSSALCKPWAAFMSLRMFNMITDHHSMALWSGGGINVQVHVSSHMALFFLFCF